MHRVHRFRRRFLAFLASGSHEPPSRVGRPSEKLPRLTLEELEDRRLLSGTPAFTQMVIFGDSLSDTGNVPALAAKYRGYIESFSPFTGDSVFTSGPTSAAPMSGTQVWDEALAGWLGLSAPTPAKDGGANYATGGAETGAGYEKDTGGWFVGGLTNGLYGYPNVGQQISDYFATTSHCPANTLYVVWAGANDILDAADKAGLGTVPVTQFDPVVYNAVVKNLEPDVAKLISSGAQYILWPNLPELSDTPHAAGYPANTNWDWPDDRYVDSGWSQSVREAVANAVQTFNADWASAIQDIRSKNPSVTIYGLDVNSLFEELLNNTYPGLPANFNTTDEALIAGSGSADNYLFWDGVHPTAYVHELLGNAAHDLIQCTNDNFASATVITGASATASGSNISATREYFEPSMCDGAMVDQSVWWQWTAPATGQVQIDTAGSDFQTALAVYTGTSVSDLTLVPNGSDCDHTDPPTAVQSHQSEVTINVDAGTTYDIAVDGTFQPAMDGTSYFTSGHITLNIQQPPPGIAALPQISFRHAHDVARLATAPDPTSHHRWLRLHVELACCNSSTGPPITTTACPPLSAPTNLPTTSRSEMSRPIGPSR